MGEDTRGCYKPTMTLPTLALVGSILGAEAITAARAAGPKRRRIAIVRACVSNQSPPRYQVSLSKILDLFQISTEKI